ncbi:MAG: alpha/beta hydrolase [Lachnospiraceae bacterium]|nr:alpha/beta hydrolase [Lachnospiraceae bacterium]
MQFHTFGNENNEVMVLIHGMLTPWQIWEDAAEYFSKVYYVVIPELDGHSQDETTIFESLEKETEVIRDYLLHNFEGKIHVLCGLSLGGRIAAGLAGTLGISVDYLVLDGAPLLKMPGVFTELLKQSYVNIIHKTRQRDYKVLESAKKEFLPERYLGNYLNIADKIEDQSVKKIVEGAFDSFTFKTYDSSMKIMFMHGTKGNELLAKKAAQKMKEANPQTQIRVFDGYRHAQLACFEPDKWIKEVDIFLLT